jgi:hypothetical protein
MRREQRRPVNSHGEIASQKGGVFDTPFSPML